MSIALQRNNSASDQSMERPAFVHRNMACVSSIYNPPDFSLRVSPVEEAEEEDRSASLPSSSTSSIGKNSDEESSGGGGEGEEEVQSECKGGALDSLDALEEVLPVKKSISKFYCGKSKSFTSLSDAASCSSMNDITKPENEYSRKRKNLMAYKHFWDRTANHTRNSHGGIPKRPNNSRSMLALAAISNCGESSNCETSNSISSSPGCSLPPLPPNARRTIYSELSSSPPADKFSSWRSFSLSDLQGAATDASSPWHSWVVDQ
ncbi:protein OXIDATIVE STRESS 3 LIKE 1-like [Henckelia pumila]|uniref:protein OXIDATIVE STRESS 3 LIKE 1-like n=1 Tax=Henckelia pumila TaxID=405737 RepID=UPI003C6E3220